MSFVYEVATKVLFLDKGKIVEEGTPDEVFNHPKSERAKEFCTTISVIRASIVRRSSVASEGLESEAYVLQLGLEYDNTKRFGLNTSHV